MEPGNFSYAKIFFRRPIWTPSNIRIAKFFAGACLLTAAAIFYGSQYYHTILFDTDRQQRLKSYLVSMAIPPVAGATAGTSTIGVVAAAGSQPSEPEIDNLSPAKEPPENVSRLVIRESSAGGENGPRFAVDPRLIDFLRDASGTSVTLRKAIVDAPALQKGPAGRDTGRTASYRVRKNAYKNSIGQVESEETASGPDAVSIASSGLTNFGVIRGSRNYEKTIASANLNSWSVKLCIERYARNNPLASGSILVRFDIHPRGHVLPESVRIIESDIQDSRVVNCIVRNIRRWRNFESLAESRGIYTLTQKFVF